MTKKIDTGTFFSNISAAYLTPQIPEVAIYGKPTDEMKHYWEKGWIRKIRSKNGKYSIPATKKQASYGWTHMTRLGFEENKIEMEKAFYNSHRLIGKKPQELKVFWDQFVENLNDYFDALDTIGEYKKKNLHF